MKRTVFCTLALLLALLTPAAANAGPTRLDGVGGSALEVDENCPVTVSAETLTFTIDGEGDYGQLAARSPPSIRWKTPPMRLSPCPWPSTWRSGRARRGAAWSSVRSPSPPTASP